MLLMKCTKNIDDMGAPAELLGFKISIIHYTAVLSKGVQCEKNNYGAYKYI